jgi:hypothetical protein
MKNVVVKENHLTFGGVAYFRAHAEEIEIGSVGEKKAPLAKQNYLQVKDRAPVPPEAVIQTTVVDIDFKHTSKTDLKMGATALVEGVPVKYTGDVTFEKLKSGELKLVKFSIPSNAIKKAVNNSPEILKDLHYWGKDARIAHQVFIVMEASLASQFSNTYDVKLSSGVKGLEAEVGVSGSSSGTTTVTISKDTCFAYLLLKIKWDNNGGEPKILDLEDDQWGVS